LEARKRLDEQKRKKDLDKQVKKFADLEEVWKGKGDNQGPQEEKLSIEEVMNRLRFRQEPITLFGEGEVARRSRLRDLEIRRPVQYDFSQEEGGRPGHLASSGDAFQGYNYFKEMQKDGDDEEDINLKKKKEREKEDPDFKMEVKEPTCDEEIVWFFLRRLIKEMGDKLDQRSPEEKKSAAGRAQSVMYSQTRVFLKPFFKKCRTRTIELEVLKWIVQIVKHCERRDYKAANDAYYRLAIGNAAWPMGVTFTSIHERAAHDKLTSDQVAHVLNDETQRKYISALKRLMTFCQEQYATVPSLSVM